jgi:HSP20 family protein
MAMQRWDPFVGLGALERDADRLWSRMFMPTTKESRTEIGLFAPTTDVLTRGDDMVVRVELPGVTESDIDISVTDDILTITGKRTEEIETTEKGGYLVRESFRGSFERSMSLPAGVDPDAIVAKYEDGVLEVVVPKAAAMHERRTRHITLQAPEHKAIEGK